VTEQPPTGGTELAAARTRKAAAPAINQDLRAWAKGMHTTAAAVELLIRGFVGRFAAPGQPWIQPREHIGRWADLEAISDNIGALSNGERAYLLITASIGSGGTDGPAINLSDTIPALDRQQLTHSDTKLLVHIAKSAAMRKSVRRPIALAAGLLCA